MSVIDDIRALLGRKGGELYGGEDVTQQEHALQCAAVAEAEGAALSERCGFVVGNPGRRIAAALQMPVGSIQVIVEPWGSQSITAGTGPRLAK